MLNDAGQTAFLAELAGPGTTFPNNNAIFSTGSGTLSQVARAGGQVPGAAAGVNFGNFNRFNRIALNASGQTAFFSLLTGTGLDSSNNSGVFSEGSGTLAFVAREGDQVPGCLLYTSPSPRDS